MTTINVIRKVSQSTRRKSGATFPGAGGGSFGGSTGGGAIFPGAGPGGLAPGFFALSLVILDCVLLLLRRRRSGRGGLSPGSPAFVRSVAYSLLFGEEATIAALSDSKENGYWKWNRWRLSIQKYRQEC